MASNNIVIPKIWEVLESEGHDQMSGLLNIWQNRVKSAKSEDSSTPKTILCVKFMKMVNLIPQDAPHPLYSSDYYDQTDTFILDHLCMEEIDLDDENLKTEEGITLKTMSEKDIVFKKDAEDEKLTVNGIGINNILTLSDGTKGLIIDDFLFSHFEETKEAFRKISKSITNQFCPLSNP